MPRGSQAPYLFFKLVRFLVEPRHLGSGRLGTAQIFESFVYREFGYFSQNPISHKSD